MGAAINCVAALLALSYCAAGALGQSEGSTEFSTGAPDAVTGLVGFARFFGPLAAGCQVDYNPEAASNSTTLGHVPSDGFKIVSVKHCTDTFTGAAIPYMVAGIANATSDFQVTSTNTIAATAALHAYNLDNHTTGFSYAHLGFPPLNPDFEHHSVFDLLKVGHVAGAEAVLATDLQFIALSTVITHAILNATNNTGSSTCNNTGALQAALALWVSAQQSFSPTDHASVLLAIDSFVDEPCLIPQAAVTVASSDLILGTVLEYTGLAQNMTHSIGGWPLHDVAVMSHLASFLSTATLHDMVNVDPAQMAANLDAAPIRPDAICSALGIANYTTSTTNVTVMYSGPVTGAVLEYRPFHSLISTNTAATGADGTVQVPHATLGIYTIPSGSVDAYLTTDTTKPVTTLVPITGIVPFGTSAITITPISALVLATYMKTQGEGFALAAPTPAQWKHAYDTLAGFSHPDGDYLARTYKRGSGAALSVFACDVLLPTLPSLGGVFFSKAINGSSVDEIVGAIFANITGKSAANLSDTATVKAVLVDVHSKLVQVTGRRLQADPLDAILTSISTSIAATNAMSVQVIAQAEAAVTAGTTPPVTLFTQIAQVAAVQNTQLAAAVQDVATLVAAGDLTAAVSAAASVQTSFTGDALKAMVASAVVNTAAIAESTIDVTASPAPIASPAPQEDSSSSSSVDKLSVGLGVGLGVGLSLLVMGAVFAFIKMRRASAVTVPMVTQAAP